MKQIAVSLEFRGVEVERMSDQDAHYACDDACGTRQSHAPHRIATADALRSARFFCDRHLSRK